MFPFKEDKSAPVLKFSDKKVENEDDIFSNLITIPLTESKAEEAAEPAIILASPVLLKETAVEKKESVKISEPSPVSSPEKSTDTLVLSDLSDKAVTKLQKNLNEMNFAHLPLLRSNLEKSTNHIKRINKNQKSQLQNSVTRISQNLESNVHSELTEIFDQSLKQIDE